MSLTINLAGVGIVLIYWLIDSNLIYIKLEFSLSKKRKEGARLRPAWLKALSVRRKKGRMGGLLMR
ncbi:hypothetical protein O987_20040 [Comamonas testosteroni TK102]|uniref:Uncharacterized protein n=1 Tax=Comamonas testosteroni TK102 TaxID=1392005 RepID=A0A076PXK4_COMTE|nr:hypothetical protein O987_20040 [Comamonas testosteroni TK102]